LPERLEATRREATPDIMRPTGWPDTNLNQEEYQGYDGANINAE